MQLESMNIKIVLKGEDRGEFVIKTNPSEGFIREDVNLKIS